MSYIDKSILGPLAHTFEFNNHPWTFPSLQTEAGEGAAALISQLEQEKV